MRVSVIARIVLSPHIITESIHESFDLVLSESALFERVSFGLEIVPASFTENVGLDLIVELHSLLDLLLLF